MIFFLLMITLDQAELAMEPTENSFRLLFPTDIHKGGIECLSNRHTHTHTHKVEASVFERVVSYLDDFKKAIVQQKCNSRLCKQIQFFKKKHFYFVQFNSSNSVPVLNLLHWCTNTKLPWKTTLMPKKLTWCIKWNSLQLSWTYIWYTID